MTVSSRTMSESSAVFSASSLATRLKLESKLALAWPRKPRWRGYGLGVSSWARGDGSWKILILFWGGGCEADADGDEIEGSKWDPEAVRYSSLLSMIRVVSLDRQASWVECSRSVLLTSSNWELMVTKLTSALLDSESSVLRGVELCCGTLAWQGQQFSDEPGNI